MSEYLSRNDIKIADDYVTKDVPVPEWGGTVRVKGLKGDERDAYEESMLDQRGKGRPKIRLTNARARLVIVAAVDQDNEPLFTDEDLSWLGKKSAIALARVADVAQELAGLTDDDLEELAGNSEKTEEGGSTTD